MIEITDSNHENFLKERPNLPKAILFTEKKGNPLIYRALSVAFDRKIEMGIVRSRETGIIANYRIKKFPSLIVIAVGDKKVKTYEDGISYKKLFDFLNVYSETFFRVGEELPRITDASKPDLKTWKLEVT